MFQRTQEAVGDIISRIIAFKKGKKASEDKRKSQNRPLNPLSLANEQNYLCEDKEDSGGETLIRPCPLCHYFLSLIVLLY